ncbi:hypothetical protein, partial [Salmonella enterica]|uniref:hypothetical protein n=1 Tax=Salmonella enterica TaxID=28901 RepID=UPI000CA9EF5B
LGIEETEESEPEVVTSGTPEDVQSEKAIFEMDTDEDDYTNYSEMTKNYDKAEDFDKISVTFLEEGEELEDYQ